MAILKNRLLILTILLAALLRFWQLSTNPPSLYVDEVSLGYNAYSIILTQKDEFGQFLPIFFRSFDTYNPGLSVYLLIPSIIAFGLGEIGVRFPSALLGTLTILLTYLLSKKLLDSEKVALASAFALAISPWHIHFSRFYHEANITLFFTVLALTVFLYNKNNFRIVVLSTIILGLSLYTSHLAKFWVFFMSLVVAFSYHKDLLKFGKKTILLATILLIFSLPIIVNFDKSFKRPGSVSVLSQHNAFGQITESYLSHLSPVFLFISGDQIGRHSVGGMGHLYVFELPLLLIGIFAALRTGNKNSRLILILLMLAPVAASFAVPAPHAGRSLIMMPYLQTLVGLGLNNFLNIRAKKELKLALVTALMVIAIYNIGTYFHLYFKHYRIEKSLDWSGGYKELVYFVNSKEENYQQVAVTSYYAHPYIYFLFYTKFDPAIYQSSGNQSKFGKYVFFPEGTWKQFESQRNTLIVTTPPNGMQNGIETIKTFNEPVFKVWESN